MDGGLILCTTYHARWVNGDLPTSKAIPGGQDVRCSPPYEISDFGRDGQLPQPVPNPFVIPCPRVLATRPLLQPKGYMVSRSNRERAGLVFVLLMYIMLWALNPTALLV